VVRVPERKITQYRSSVGLETGKPLKDRDTVPEPPTSPLFLHTCKFWTSTANLRFVKIYWEVQKVAVGVQPMWYKCTLSVGQVE